jgi:hypothetical protein
MRGHDPIGRVRKLSRAALAFRAFHAVIAVEMLLAIAYVWWCELSGRRDRLLRVAAASLQTTEIARLKELLERR